MIIETRCMILMWVLGSVTMGAVPRGFSNHTMDKAKSGGKGWHGGGGIFRSWSSEKRDLDAERKTAFCYIFSERSNNKKAGRWAKGSIAAQ